MLKPLKFVANSKQELSDFPDAVKQDVGHSLYLAQKGSRDRNVKTLKGFHGGSVVEIVEDHDGDTFRCVYTTKLVDFVVVLHAFQKKSKQGIATPKHEIDLIQNRLRDALARNWRD
jgi:phage-related protein